jgi:hypothetical protein
MKSSSEGAQETPIRLVAESFSYPPLGLSISLGPFPGEQGPLELPAT